ncbi:SAC3/GANP/Nin1/mts3/eIF-3 p25 family-domain-containing protein [Xylogone sp. PMI_703]|nr:SAC3/GANP/Nin1/mts3/eIF-3 p25 family-domain-containing protein [Xylogone sp. PMI_703]
MADLQAILSKLKSTFTTAPYTDLSSLLSKGKIALLKQNALTPTKDTPSELLRAARELFEIGALVSIRAKDASSFVKYVQLLRSFYELPNSRYGPSQGEDEKNKITGLYLLLLLTQGDYAGFHTELEGLETREGGEVEEDRFLGYPIRLERWLMEGAYDLVWKAMAKREVPTEEFGVFSEILTSQIRSEIASCSETAYPSLPISSTKDLLFLESEGAVIQFAQSRGWAIKDGRIYFPTQKPGATEDGEEGEEDKEFTQTVIENTLGYARELETIV